MINNHLALVTLLLSIFSIWGLAYKSKHIGEFETLSYDHAAVHQLHKRSTERRSKLQFELPAFGRTLKVEMNQDSSDFLHDEAVLEFDGEVQKLDSSIFYKGNIVGEPNSLVVGSITNGVFQGKIETMGEIYQVERIFYHPHLTDLHPEDETASHSVIFKRDQFNADSFKRSRRSVDAASSSDGYCGSRDAAIAEWMERVKRSATDQTEEVHLRTTRATTKKTCNLLIQTDPELWAYMKNQLESSAPTSMIKDEITSLIGYFMTEVNGIYGGQNFKGASGTIRNGYQLRLDRLKVHQSCTGSEHSFCNKNIDVSNFLNLLTYTNYNDYCLAYAFTHRDFSDGTLGLAWVGEGSGWRGGICSKYQKYNEANGDVRFKSLNTGIVTTKNYGEVVPRIMSSITFAHELGHNFGSNHDVSGKSPSCTPYAEGSSSNGNYIMFARAIEGDGSNNFQFSPCSLKSIGNVLDKADGSTDRKCLQENSGSFCGNNVLEAAEICDCGYRADCEQGDADCCRCCNERELDTNSCQLKNSAICDPSQGMCCSETTCGYIPSASQILCAKKTDCAANAYCHGNSSKCPKQTAINDNKGCHNQTQVCSGGICTGTICSLIGRGDWKRCSLQRNGDNAGTLCFVQCEEPITSKCWSSFNLNDAGFPADFKAMLQDVSIGNNGKAIDVPAGSTCDRDNGFCDHFQICRGIDEQGPYSRIKNLITNLTDPQQLAAWLKFNWWIPVIIVFAIVGVTTLLVVFGAKFTPSSNPEKSKPRKLSKPFIRGQKPRSAAGPAVGERRSDFEMS